MFKRVYLEIIFNSCVIFEFLKNWIVFNKSYLSKSILNFIKFSYKKNKSLERNNSEAYIFIDIFKIPHHLYITNCVTAYLAKKFNFSVKTYNTKSRSVFDEVYNSLNIGHKVITQNKDTIKVSKNHFMNFFLNKPSKKKLINFKINNVNLGIDIYESILKSGRPTVLVNKLATYYYFILGLKYFMYFEDLFKKDKIKACFLSHDCYIQCGILSKLSIRNKIPLFYVNERGICFSEKEFDNYWIFKRYKKYFKSIVKKKPQALNKAKIDLKERLSGKLGVKINNQTKSAFLDKKISDQVHKTKNKKILIAAHCFYDNPHGYGKMIFPDFWEWLTYIKKVANKTSHDWYIKPHRDYLHNTIENINKIIDGSKIKLIDPETSFHQLKKEGIEYIVTKHGSVGHELPLLGFTVINFGYNPQINYNFNYHCLNKKSFETLIIKKLKPKKINVNEIYEFFYVHHYFLHDDKYFFKSFEKYKKYLNYNLKNDKGYDYLINHDQYLSKKMISNFKKFIKMKNKYSIENKLKKKIFKNVKINFN